MNLGLGLFSSIIIGIIAGWLAEKIMSCGAGSGGDGASMVAEEGEVDSGRSPEYSALGKAAARCVGRQDKRQRGRRQGDGWARL